MAQNTIPFLYADSSEADYLAIIEACYPGFLFQFDGLQYETLYIRFMKYVPGTLSIAIELINSASPLYACYGDNTVVVVSKDTVQTP